MGGLRRLRRTFSITGRTAAAFWVIRRTRSTSGCIGTIGGSTAARSISGKCFRLICATANVDGIPIGSGLRPAWEVPRDTTRETQRARHDVSCKWRLPVLRASDLTASLWSDNMPAEGGTPALSDKAQPQAARLLAFRLGSPLAPRRGPVKGGRRSAFAPCAPAGRPSLDGPERGSTLDAAGTPCRFASAGDFAAMIGSPAPVQCAIRRGPCNTPSVLSGNHRHAGVRETCTGACNATGLHGAAHKVAPHGTWLRHGHGQSTRDSVQRVEQDRADVARIAAGEEPVLGDKPQRPHHVLVGVVGYLEPARRRDGGQARAISVAHSRWLTPGVAAPRHRCDDLAIGRADACPAHRAGRSTHRSDICAAIGSAPIAERQDQKTKSACVSWLAEMPVSVIELLP